MTLIGLGAALLEFLAKAKKLNRFPISNSFVGEFIQRESGSETDVDMLVVVALPMLFFLSNRVESNSVGVDVK